MLFDKCSTKIESFFLSVLCFSILDRSHKVICVLLGVTE